MIIKSVMYDVETEMYADEDEYLATARLMYPNWHWLQVHLKRLLIEELQQAYPNGIEIIIRHKSKLPDIL